MPKHAGVYNMQTGKFHPAGGPLSAVPQTVYNNTCSTIAPFVYLLPTTQCEDTLEPARVPTGGVGPDHFTNTWEVGYCTVQAAGAVDVDWEVVDTASNVAGGGTSCFPVPPAPAFTNTLVGFDSSAAGFPLPGSTNASFACWLVTFTSGTFGACLTSGATSTDQFTYRLRSNAKGLGGGYILAGDPNLVGGAPGSGTFAIPPATDIAGNPCGNGLDNSDDSWGNTDNTPIGGVPPAACVGAYPTGCFFFGGYPTAPYASMYFRMEGDGSCSCSGSISFYCTAKTSSKGCVPAVSTSGAPVAAPGACSAPAFNLIATNLIGNKSGQWFYSGVGPAGAPFLGGHLCVGSKIKRLPTANTGGAGSTCNGSLTANFNARICGGTDAQLTAGKQVWAQAQYRDNGFAVPNNVTLTSGVTFTICP